MSSPTVDKRRPIINDRKAFTLEPIAIKIEQLKPSKASQKYSNELN